MKNWLCGIKGIVRPLVYASFLVFLVIHPITLHLTVPKWGYVAAVGGLYDICFFFCVFFFCFSLVILFIYFFFVLFFFSVACEI